MGCLEARSLITTAFTAQRAAAKLIPDTRPSVCVRTSKDAFTRPATLLIHHHCSELAPRRCHLPCRCLPIDYAEEETEGLPNWTKMAMHRRRAPTYREQNEQLGTIDLRPRCRVGVCVRFMEAQA